MSDTPKVDETVIKLEDLKRVKFEPGDKIIARYGSANSPMDEACRNSLKHYLAMYFPFDSVIVVPEEVELFVMSPHE